jgi:hypothetical protein
MLASKSAHNPDGMSCSLQNNGLRGSDAHGTVDLLQAV